MSPARILYRIPGRPRPVKPHKGVVGPIRPLGRGIHFMLHYVYPGPGSWRVEPHLVIDPTGSLELRGVYVVEGPVVLARYEGLREAMSGGVAQGVFPRFHLAPWGAPVVYVDSISKPDEDAARLLDSLGAWRALRWMESLEVEVVFE
ncbi:MAG: hypothetical protein LRS49_02900 [Desulfurococcales archaeon]|nr:hypothetical protein [Desulfurococcales archaeon]